MNSNNNEISDFSMFLLKKLYLIEGVVIKALASNSTSNETYLLAKEVQELCAESLSGIEEQFEKMTKRHNEVD